MPCDLITGLNIVCKEFLHKAKVAVISFWSPTELLREVMTRLALSHRILQPSKHQPIRRIIQAEGTYTQRRYHGSNVEGAQGPGSRAPAGDLGDIVPQNLKHFY